MLPALNEEVVRLGTGCKPKRPDPMGVWVGRDCGGDPT